MAERLSLNGSWVLADFYDEDWRRHGSLRREPQPVGAFARVRWRPVTVPGSVHWDLLGLGEIPDPYWEENSRLTEWVHQRSWVYKRDFTVPEDWKDRRVFLHLDGLDFAAEVFLDGEHIGSHASTHAPLELELTGRVRAGSSHHLAVALLPAPPEPGQIGRTSAVRTTKPRMGYWWDFGARLVNLGIQGDVWLEATGPVKIEDVWVRVTLSDKLDHGTVDVTIRNESWYYDSVAVEIAVLSPTDQVLARKSARYEFDPGLGASKMVHRLEIPNPALWWPNNLGEQPLYRCRIEWGDSAIDSVREVRFGFRALTLEPNPGAGADALPYTFTVNGRPMFVKGWNWVPPDLMYGRPDLAEKYRHLLTLARDSGANLIRVNGVGLIEREHFYTLCDELGLLVWQEFPLTSSGIDNVPATDAAYLETLEREARAVVPLRRHHPSLALWGGGNELTDLERRPLTVEHPAVATLQRVVRELDPDRPFLPTSPSGPTYDLDAAVAQQRPGDLHDVHGPWHHRGPLETYRPFNVSTALLHSEFGSQGAVAQSSLDRFMARERQWPPDDANPLWVHHGSWWLHRHRVEELFGPVETLEAYLPLSQFLQADALRYQIEGNRRRWPRCSGAIPWQLCEPWPNAHNTSVVDHYGRPKMAYHWAARAYAPVAASLRHEGLLLEGGALRATPYVVAEREFRGTLCLTLLDPADRTWLEVEHPVAGEGGLELPALEWPLPSGLEVAICRLRLEDEEERVIHENDYLFGRGEHPLVPLRRLPAARLEARREGDELALHNVGPGWVLWPAADLDDPRVWWRVKGNFPLIPPGGTARLKLELSPRFERAEHDSPHGRDADGVLLVRVSGMNVSPLELGWES